MSAILLDIEGTVSDKRFVAETLFPFARARIKAFVCDHTRDGDVAAALSLMRAKIGRSDASLEEIGDRARALDRRGQEGRAAEIVARPDLEARLRRGRAGLHTSTRTCCQRLSVGRRRASASPSSPRARLRRRSSCSPIPTTAILTRISRGYFDLSTGPKFEAASYAKIAKALDLPPVEDSLLFRCAARGGSGARGAGLDAVAGRA